jgi:hypothetical protein
MPRKKKPTTVSPTLNVEIATTRPAKRRAPRSAFQKGNTHRISPGETRNPYGRTGKPKPQEALISKNLTIQLRDRAPQRVAEALGFEPNQNASWAMCLAQRLLRVAVTGDLHAGGHGTVALEMIMRLTEQLSVKSPGALAEAVLDSQPRIEVCFVESDGDGRLKPADMEAGLFSAPQTIQGQPPRPLLPDGD